MTENPNLFRRLAPLVWLLVAALGPPAVARADAAADDKARQVAFAVQALGYVMPSQPHTGVKSWVQAAMIGSQVPFSSESPHAAETGKLQKLPAAHSEVL